MHAYVDALVGFACDCQKLDRVAELARHLDIGGGDVADALHEHVVGGDTRLEADRRENGDFGGGVEAVDVGGGVGFGVACGLRGGQNLVEGEAFVLHAGEDVVRGAVHDARDGEDIVADQVVFERVDDGDAAGRCGFTANLHALFGREGREMLDVAAKEGLVCRYDMLAVLEGLLEDFGRRMLAADELDDDMDIGVVHDVAPVGGEDTLGKADALGFRLVAAACALDHQVDSVVLEVFVVVLQDETGDAAADGAEADEAEVHALHTLYSFDMH